MEISCFDTSRCPSFSSARSIAVDHLLWASAVVDFRSGQRGQNSGVCRVPYRRGMGRQSRTSDSLDMGQTQASS